MQANILLERWDDAAAYAEKMAASSRPTFRRQGLEAQARVTMYRGKSRQALALMDSRLAEHPERDVVRADLLNDLGFTRLSSGDAAGAVAAFEESREISSETWQEVGSSWGLAYARARLGESEAAEAAAERLLTLVESVPSEFPERWRRHLEGIFALASEDFPTAIAELEAAAAMMPEHSAYDNEITNLRFYLAQAYMGSGEAEKAAEQLKLIVDSGMRRAFRPDLYVRSFYLLGQIALERGDLEEAKTYFQRFLDHWADGDLDRDRVAQAKRVVG